ncbi:hypothetical protein ACFSR2_21185 [Emticicia soli]|uniref:Uncharacterized protein n=1 Tax=Emticicia soli TaxID=2027878 RepID=A0ABW5JCW9_9BACT
MIFFINFSLVYFLHGFGLKKFGWNYFFQTAQKKRYLVDFQIDKNRKKIHKILFGYAQIHETTEKPQNIF